MDANLLTKRRNLIDRCRAMQLWNGPGAGHLVTMRRIQSLADILGEVSNELEKVLDELDVKQVVETPTNPRSILQGMKL